MVKTTEQDTDELKQGFIELGKKFKFETEDINFAFVPDMSQQTSSEVIDSNEINSSNLDIDCMYSRLITKSGVYNCPRLINDYRGRCGASLSDYSSKCYLETEKCLQCKKFGKRMYTNSWI